MRKSGVVGRAPRNRGRRPRAELQNVVEGQIAEICRDLAVEAKRIRQLQEQANELRTVIRHWVTSPKQIGTTSPLVVEDDAEQ